ncbi:helix-turn-helix transcriptional regulator [Lentibacillus sediminis]|uniref:helix-turn-helix transcriptional regulator n=1 Tax=Lentibacillus sediminis TaxID=1940529 RepID=UPI000C1B89DC|nr:helix-turn-helix transcriptional regulator [Lentibacillus sediminis]
MKNNLKEFRDRKSYSQERLAKELGVSRQTIISIEKGRYNPSLPLALQIGKIFDAYVEDIFLLEENEER